SGGRAVPAPNGRTPFVASAAEIAVAPGVITGVATVVPPCRPNPAPGWPMIAPELVARLVPRFVPKLRPNEVPKFAFVRVTPVPVVPKGDVDRLEVSAPVPL